jgi:hypothetical protein
MPGNTPPAIENQESTNREFKMIEQFLRQNNVLPMHEIPLPRSKGLSSHDSQAMSHAGNTATMSDHLTSDIANKQLSTFIINSKGQTFDSQRLWSMQS